LSPAGWKVGAAALGSGILYRARRLAGRAVLAETLRAWGLTTADVTVRDGSGLSRYNLVTPRYLSGVLGARWQQQPHERLFDLFPAGGRDGTLSEWYTGPDGKPYVYAKSGSMTGVQCLSGYVVGKSGKVLIFSFMHNNFTGNGKPWTEAMQRILEQMRDQF